MVAPPSDLDVVVLAGGVGGSKLVRGLAAEVDRDHLTIIVNTADDFEHLGLWISPDVDTVVHRLAGVHDPDHGWGRANDTWRVMDAVEALGGPDWFRLGDTDLATSLVRTHRRRQGASLSTITRDIATALGVRHRVVPMTDDVVATIVHTDEGELGFQDWFVARRCAPTVHDLEFRGAADATTSTGLANTIATADVVVLAPSNPFLSIDPILAVPAIGAAIAARRPHLPTIAVSPIVGGRALKGPAAALLSQFDLPVSATGVARHLAPAISAIVVAPEDLVEVAGVERVESTSMVMDDEDSERALARDVLAAVHVA